MEKKTTSNETAQAGLPLNKQNYYLMLAGLVVIIIGFVLMSGGKSNDPNVFNGEQLYSFRRITLAPIFIIAGFVFEVYAIMKRPSGKADE